MTEKKPFWKNGILWVWSEHYQHYVANYVPPHYMLVSMGISFDEFKDLMDMDYGVKE